MPQAEGQPRPRVLLPPGQRTKSAPKKEGLTETVVAMRKQNLSIYEISEALASEGKSICPAAVYGILKGEGFSRLPRGEDALVEKHYVSKRCRQKGMLAFLAQDAETRVFYYANSELRKDEQPGEIIRFAEFWQKRTGKYPHELIFDAKLTTYPNLSALSELEISFITLRRRSAKMLRGIASEPPGAWRRVELGGVARAYRHPRVLDRKITLKGYKGAIRQLTIADLGHEEPTLLLTSQMKRSAAKLITRYAQRMVIENQISDGIDFFHMDDLSSAVAMKVDCDLHLTLMASSLYRLLGSRIGNGDDKARSRRIFRDFVEATAMSP